MCGIAGAFSWSEASAFDATRTAADLGAALAHRGPDGEGTFTDPGLLLGHRGVAFASEIAALRRASLVARDVSPAGVLAFLAWSYIPSPLTWLRGVESLTPGTWKRWHDGGREEGGTFADFATVYDDQAAVSED